MFQLIQTVLHWVEVRALCIKCSAPVLETISCTEASSCLTREGKTQTVSTLLSEITSVLLKCKTGAQIQSY